MQCPPGAKCPPGGKFESKCVINRIVRCFIWWNGALKETVETLKMPLTKKVWQPLKCKNYEQVNANKKKKIENVDEMDKFVE